MVRARSLCLLAALLAGCEAAPGGAGSADAGGLGDAGYAESGAFCGVYRSVLAPRCTACHKPGGNVPDLTLSGVQSGLIQGASPQYPGQVWVVPGDPAASFLYQKIAGPPGASFGLQMPVAAPLPAAEIEAIAAWIRDGASTACVPAGDGGVGEPDGGVFRHHPEGFADPAVHGTEMKLQLQDCRTCHGTDLTGGAGPSCDGCHQPGWRTSCVYCHGGAETQTGAPPRELDGNTDPTSLRFRAHTAHTTERNHAAWDCAQCHGAVPEDVLSAGHAFDSTPGAAELDFSHGLSAAGTYQGSGSCANLYCHGNGRSLLGRYQHTDPRPTCVTCHAGSASSLTQRRTMSGDHADHLGERIRCDECHGAVVDASETIIDPGLHVNGQKEVQFTAAISYSGGTCSGTCHNEPHNNRRW